MGAVSGAFEAGLRARGFRINYGEKKEPGPVQARITAADRT